MVEFQAPLAAGVGDSVWAFCSAQNWSESGFFRITQSPQDPPDIARPLRVA